VPYYDNPAGRLHDLLTKLSQQDKRSSLLDCWATVLHIDADDVVLHLGRVADLVRQTQDAVDRIEEDVFVQTVRRYRADWARPFFPPDHAFNNPLAKVLLEPPALEALGMVSVHLHSTAPEGVMPDDAQVEQLRAQVREVIDGVRAAEDIPDDLKHTIILRLQDVEDALEHLDISGPSAVRHATEAVIGSVALMTGGTRLIRSPTIQKVCATVALAWAVFSTPPTIENSLESWEKVIPQLTAAIEKPLDSPETQSPGPDPPPPVDGEGGTEAPASAR
jgi:hypothetical protein